MAPIDADVGSICAYATRVCANRSRVCPDAAEVRASSGRSFAPRATRIGYRAASLRSAARPRARGMLSHASVAGSAVSLAARRADNLRIYTLSESTIFDFVKSQFFSASAALNFTGGLRALSTGHELDADGSHPCCLTVKRACTCHAETHRRYAP